MAEPKVVLESPEGLGEVAADVLQETVRLIQQALPADQDMDTLAQ